MQTLARVGCAMLAAGLSHHVPAHAEWFGGVGITSDNIERGVSQSDRKPSANASVRWRHPAGGYASLGIASVSDTQYAGSDGYKLMPEIGWSIRAAEEDVRADVFLRGQAFPGARGPWFGSLPPRLQTQATQATSSNYGTLELGGLLAWKTVTLAVSRSLSDYLGLAAKQTGPAGDKVIESKGTTYISLDVDWPLNEAFTLSAGMGRLHVPNFDGLFYTDWRVGTSMQAAGLQWRLQASGSSASADRYRLRNRSDGSAAGSARVTASVGWTF